MTRGGIQNTTLTNQVDASNKLEVRLKSHFQHSVRSVTDPFDHPPLTLIHFVPFPLSLVWHVIFQRVLTFFHVALSEYGVFWG